MRSFLYSIFCVALLSSCLTEPNYPDTPAITFEEISGYSIVSSGFGGNYDSIVVKLHFEDGDGDIGLENNDTIPPYHLGDSVLVDGVNVFEANKYHNNYFVTVYKKVDGTFEEVVFPDPTVTYNGRVPLLANLNSDSAIDGDLYYTMQFISSLSADFNQFDTLKFDIHIADRALNESNVITTDEVVLMN